MRIPNGWQQVSLGEVVALQRGYDLPSTDRISGQFHVIGGGGPNGSHQVSNVAGPGVVIGRSGSGFGRAWWSKDDYWAHNTGMFVKDFKGNHPKFVYYFLDHIDFSSYNSGGAQPSLNRNFIYPIPVALPPLAEQRKIAEILRAWDNAIDTHTDVAAALRKRRTAVVSSLIFGAGAPQGLRWTDTNPTWSIQPIGMVAEEKKVRNSALNTEAVLTCSKHRGFVKSSDYFSKTVHSADLTNYKVVRRNEFGFPSNHIEEGSIGLQNIVDSGAVSPIYTVFAFDDSVVEPKFAFLALKSSHYTEMFKASTSSSVDRRGSLRWKEFSKLPFVIPPMSEQRNIVNVVSVLDQEIDLTEKLTLSYTEQKRGLMQQLLTDKIRVKVS